MPDIPPAVFEHARLPGSRFADLDLSGSSFDDVNLRQACFYNVALTGASFRNTSLAQVSIDDCNLEGLRINGLLVTDLLARAAGGNSNDRLPSTPHRSPTPCGSQLLVRHRLGP